MPIPTDTYWNIKRLNWVFALSTLALLGVTGWATLQDHDKDWRNQQKSGRVWDAAITTDKLRRDLTAEKKSQLDTLQKEIEAAGRELEPRRKEIAELHERIRRDDSDRSTMEFQLNTLKANVGVMESLLQDAVTAGDTKRVEQRTAEIAGPRKKLFDDTEALARKTDDLMSARRELAAKTTALDARVKQKKKLEADAESLRKKLGVLQPTSLFAKLSDQIRNAPLLDFINPSDKIQQIVLDDVRTDVAFMKIATIDRCTTCHVNIGKKEFLSENVLGYLEEQAATARGYRLPETILKPTGAAATASKPGAVAVPEFWQAWALKLTPDTVRRNAGRIGTITATVGKTATVTYDGQVLASFKYNATPSTQPSTQPASDPAAQNAVLIALLEAWYRTDSATDGAIVPGKAQGPRVQVEVSPNVDKKTADNVRDVAMRYAEELKKGVMAQFPPALTRPLIEDQYRYALAAVVNAERRKQGLAALDPSPALLAHARLDLYVDADSKHPFEGGENKIGVGCTSCHDGSGQETDFVLVAHTPRQILVDEKSGVPVLPQELSTSAKHRIKDDLSDMLAALMPEEKLVPTGFASLYFEQDEAAHKAEAGEHAEHGQVAYVDPVTGRSGRAVSQMDYWKRRYGPEAPRSFELVYHEWDWPMRPPEYLQANCVRCHAEVYDIKDDAPVVFEGRRLFAELGCVNCHQMDSIPKQSIPQNDGRDAPSPELVMANGQVKVGPSLVHVTSKLSPAFINTWVWAPKSFRPSTRMPHFFMLENNSSDEELRRTRQEARAMTEYLTRTATPLAPANVAPPGAKGSPEGGRVTFNAVGCLGCHANLNDATDQKRGGKSITLGEKWIVTDLVKSGRLKADMMLTGAKDPDEKSLRVEAEKLYDAMNYNQRQMYVKEHLEQEPGATEVAKYPDGTAKPIFVHVGPELSGIGTKLLAGRTDEQARGWLFDWLKEPRHYNSYTIMPRLRLSDQQAVDLVEYLLTQKRTTDRADDPWRAGLAEPDTQKLIELTALFLRNKASVATSVVKADDEKELTELAVDALTTAVQTADEAKGVVAKMSRDEKRLVFLGKKLIGHYGCMSCHAINGAEKITSPCANLSDWGQKGVDKLDYGYVDPHKIHSLPTRRPIMMVNGLSAEASQLAFKPINFANERIARPVHAAWPLVEHLRTSWLEQKLRNSRIYDRGRGSLDPVPGSTDPMLGPGKPYDKIKMPTFYLSDEQVRQLVTFVISNRDRLISDRLLAKTVHDASRQIARGRELTMRYN
ncbi:MAG: multiheme c-type cytochrome, partial [Tepidisphaeraceae bacterium]